MVTFNRVVTLIGLALIVLAFILANAHPSTASGKVWQRCLTDEGFEAQTVNCVWDARHDGNGEGRSFYVNRSGLHYVAHWRAHKMLGLS